GTLDSAESWTLLATREPNEPPHSAECSAERTIWFKWRAPVTSPVVIDSIGAYFPTAMAVYTGQQLSALTRVTQGQADTRMLAFDAVKDTEYRIAVGAIGSVGGHIQLNLRTVTVAPQEPDAIYHLQFSGGDLVSLILRGDKWELRSNGAVLGSGALLSYERGQNSCTLTVEHDGKKRTWKLKLNKPHSGEWMELEGETAKPIGKLRRFVTAGETLALPDLTAVRLAGTREWTTTGTSGQTHYYTFTPDGRFHDTDNDEQASGSYTYERTGPNTARLQLFYEGPGDFTGDYHDIDLNFQNGVGGKFDSHYMRNDHTAIIVKGAFEVLD
ncbi:MAG TPA: hypothetical protein VEH27_11685, partial [Methylomirabilota bacterium]|nr:hypothetical protein [Methylomirabilota bacterium]